MENQIDPGHIVQEIQQMISRGLTFCIHAHKRYEDENEEQHLLYAEIEKELRYARRHLAAARDAANKICYETKPEL